MLEILESRNVKIKSRIITIENIKRLSAIIRKRYDEKIAEEKHCRLSFRVTCFDESTFESSDAEFFSNDSVLPTKRVSDISLKFSSYDDDETIEIKLSHGDSSYSNYISVSARDSEWVNGVTRKIEDEICAFKPQNTFLTEYKVILEVVFALSIGMVYFFLIDMIPIHPIEVEPSGWMIQLALASRDSLILGYTIKYILSFVIGIWPAYSLMDKLKALWPSIEIQIGPEHTFIEKRRRIWIASAFLVGVVPLATSLIYDVLKAIFTN